MTESVLLFSLNIIAAVGGFGASWFLKRLVGRMDVLNDRIGMLEKQWCVLEGAELLVSVKALEKRITILEVTLRGNTEFRKKLQ